MLKKLPQIVLKDAKNNKRSAHTVHKWQNKTMLTKKGTKKQRWKKIMVLHKQGLSKKYFTQKKCVNFDKSNSRQNSVKDPNSERKMPKSNKTFQNVLELPSKGAKLQHYLLSQQNSVKFCKDFIRDRIFLHKHCSHGCTLFHFCKEGV